VKGIALVKKLVLAAFLCLAALPLAAQVNDTYLIPVSVNAPGAFSTRWMTQFSLMNPQLDYDLVISVTWIPTGGATGFEELVEVPANSVAYSDNILDDLFGVRSGSGALLVATFPEDNPGVPDEVISRAFLVTSNTFNNSPSGTYGQTVPGVWAGLMDYETDGISAIAHGVRHVSSLGWRTNVGAVNLGRCSVDLHLNVYDADGNTVATRLWAKLPPLAHHQEPLPIEVDRASVEFFVDDPCANSSTNFAVVFPYVSTIDQLSGDPTYQSPTLLANASALFSKKGLTRIDTTALGKKIDSTYARDIRAKATRLGKATLTREGKGYKITK
jgi:hypothetical protein